MSTKGFHQKLLLFKHFHFGLGGSNKPSEPPEPPLDPPQHMLFFSNNITHKQ